MSKKINTQEINKHINKAIATTVVVTTIGVTSAMNGFPVRASATIGRKSGETYATANVNEVKEITSELINMKTLIRDLLKEGKYQEAREIRRSFEIENALATKLKQFRYYAVHIV